MEKEERPGEGKNQEEEEEEEVIVVVVEVEESQTQSERFLPPSVSFVTVWREDVRAHSLSLSVGLLASLPRRYTRARCCPSCGASSRRGGGVLGAIGGSDTSVLALLCVIFVDGVHLTDVLAWAVILCLGLVKFDDRVLSVEEISMCLGK